MAKTLQEAGFRIYWFTWAVLLFLTLLMLVVSSVPIPRLLLAVFLVLAMFGKASLIGAHFMHLRFEKLSLILTVVVGIFATAAFLFVLIAFDGIRILRLSLT